MNRLVPVTSPQDIFLEYHNLGRVPETYTRAQLLIGMCMDNRKHLRIPDNFAYILRAGGANLRYSEFKVSYAIGVGGVTAIGLIGHDNCGMVDLVSRKDAFVQGLVENAGWQAEQHFAEFAPLFEIGDEIGFVVTEVQRLRRQYPRIRIAPMLYQVESGQLCLIKENEDLDRGDR